LSKISVPCSNFALFLDVFDGILKIIPFYEEVEEEVIGPPGDFAALTDFKSQMLE